jgi:hypothetical protein
LATPGGQIEWNLGDLSAGDWHLANGCRLEEIQIQSVPVRSDDGFASAVARELNGIRQSRRRQRMAQVPDCSSKTDDKNDSPGGETDSPG